MPKTKKPQSPIPNPPSDFEPLIHPWIQTVSGRKIDLVRPDPESLVIGDIAHALARINRFNGHTLGKLPYSVAQHSWLVSRWVQENDQARMTHDGGDRGLALAALLHDAHEAYVGDLTRPVKELLASQFLQCCVKRFDSHFEDKWLAQSKFGLAHSLIHQADLVLLATEQRDLMAPPPEPWIRLPQPWPGMKIHPWGVEEAELRFLARFKELGGNDQFEQQSPGRRADGRALRPPAGRFER